MSDPLRYLVSIDPASKAIKVEQIGEAGELTEVDPIPFVQSLGAGMAGVSQPAQVVINIYTGGGPASGPVRLAVSGALPESIRGFDPGPPPPPPPPHGKPGKPGKK